MIYLQMIETDEDKSKFESLYKAYRGLAFHVAYKRLGNVQDAEDAVHHVFVKIAENIKKIEPVCPNTKQLIVTMVENRAIDVFRVKSRHPAIEYNDERNHGTVEAAETEDLLTRCILKLPERQRAVLWLKYVHGYSLHEISRLLGISLASAQKTDQRAKKRLAELYTEGGGTL